MAHVQQTCMPEIGMDLRVVLKPGNRKVAVNWNGAIFRCLDRNLNKDAMELICIKGPRVGYRGWYIIHDAECYFEPIEWDA